MAKINLLPWRAERRKQREREFFVQLGVAAAAAVVVLMLAVSWMGLRVDNQNERNAYLQGEIKQVDAKISEIKDLEKTRARLLARKEIIEQLQANRSQMVHLFDELVKRTPSSVRLTAMKQTGSKLLLDGVAQSNASVATYMRNIEASPWLGPADLTKTEKEKGNSSVMPYVFGLDVTLSKPKSKDDGSAAAAAGPATPAKGGARP